MEDFDWKLILAFIGWSFTKFLPLCQILDTWLLQHSSNSKEMQTLNNQFQNWQNWQDAISKLVNILTRFAFSNYMRLAPQSIVFLFSFAFSYLHIPKYSPKKMFLGVQRTFLFQNRFLLTFISPIFHLSSTCPVFSFFCIWLHCIL